MRRDLTALGEAAAAADDAAALMLQLGTALGTEMHIIRGNIGGRRLGCVGHRGAALGLQRLGTTAGLVLLDILCHLGNHLGQSRFRALNTFTRRLPMIKPEGEIKDYGTDTVEAMTSGVVLGMIFEVEGYLRKYPGHTVVFTGGDSFYFAEKLKSSIFVIPNLVLVGLALIADYYVQQEIGN